MKLVISILIVLVTANTYTFGQHIHKQHPNTTHDGEWQRAYLDGPGHSTPIVKLDSNSLHVIFSEWLTNSTCNEAVERGNNYERSVTHAVSVNLTGSYEWGAEAGAKVLAAEMKATTKAKIELAFGWTGTWTEKLSFSSKVKLKKCQKIWYVFTKTRKKASGSVITWEHKMKCVNIKTGKSEYSFCDRRELSGKSVGWGTHVGEHVQRGLVKPCPCRDIDEDSVHVFDPSIPVPVPDPNPTSETEVTPVKMETPIEMKQMNPIRK